MMREEQMAKIKKKQEKAVYVESEPIIQPITETIETRLLNPKL